MVVILHIFIAVSSIILASVAFFKPSRLLLRASYGFIAATLASGMYLVILSPAKMLHVCISGLAYTVVVAVITRAARARFMQFKKSEQK